MEQYEREKWREELKECFSWSGGKDTDHWERIVSNLGLFFLKHERVDIAKLLWEFVCQYGEFTQLSAFNLSSCYLSLAKSYTRYGTTAKSTPIDLSKLDEEGSVHPDSIEQELLKRRDLLAEVD